eukprot:6179036-Pleurochrysis_carterae.AAC.3
MSDAKAHGALRQGISAGEMKLGQAQHSQTSIRVEDTDHHRNTTGEKRQDLKSAAFKARRDQRHLDLKGRQRSFTFGRALLPEPQRGEQPAVRAEDGQRLLAVEAVDGAVVEQLKAECQHLIDVAGLVWEREAPPPPPPPPPTPRARAARGRSGSGRARETRGATPTETTRANEACARKAADGGSNDRANINSCSRACVRAGGRVCRRACATACCSAPACGGGAERIAAARAD